MSKRVDASFFPWEDVEAYDNNPTYFQLFSKVLKENSRHTSCPQCGKDSSKLRWVWFRSSAWTWENLMGQAGYLSICDNCHRQVDFICVIRN